MRTQYSPAERWADAVPDFERAQRAERYPLETVLKRCDHVSRLSRAVEVAPFEMTHDDLVEWLGSMRLAAETRRSHRSTLRSFYPWAQAIERTTRDPAAELPVTKPGQPRPRPAAGDVYREACAKASLREFLALRLVAELGLRRGEIVEVHSRDVELTPGSESLIAQGKGDKERRIPPSKSLAVALRELPEGYAFPGNYDGHLSPTTLGKKVSGLLPPSVAVPALRHRFATRAYEIDHDVFTVQQPLGHASLETTRRYVRVSDASLRRLVDRLAS